MNLKRLFGLNGHAPAPPVSTRSPHEGPSTIEDGSANALRRQLIQVLLQDSMRRHGIPAGWLDCQMLLVSSRSRGEGMYLRLIIKHWDIRLLTYALAFQKSLMVDITRFEPHADQWLYGISWQIDCGDSCPYTSLPDRHVWQSPTAHPLAAGGDIKQDVAHIFAIRDADMQVHGADAAFPAGTLRKH
jgi:hypothetical protein